MLLFSNEEIREEITTMVHDLHETQYTDGTWRFCFEGPPLTDCYTIILLHCLGIGDESLISKLADRLLSIQSENGTWKLYEDEQDGNLSATIQCYFALLCSKAAKKSDTNMKKAERYIKSQGGLTKAHFTTKFILSVCGQYPWPTAFYIPMSILMLPKFSPLSIYSISNYARIHFIPMAICGNKRLSLRSNSTPDVSHLFTTPPSLFTQSWIRESRLSHEFLTQLKKLASYPLHIHEQGLKKAEKFLLDRIESNGTLYSYATSTVVMVFALLALGYTKDSPIIQKAIKGLKSLSCPANDQVHIQNSPSTVWDTALLSYALQKAGVSADVSMIHRANEYLLSRQHKKYGDWTVHNPNTEPGGWGFSDINTIIPDIDDTTAALRAITSTAQTQHPFQVALSKGQKWLLSMQNNDGGWPSFEKNVDQKWLATLPIENANFTLRDSSTADLTGRTLEYLGNFAGYDEEHPQVKQAVNWLINNQEENGSWYGKWGICYIYGTWAAVTGLRAVGIQANHPCIRKAIRWLKNIQNNDGGWGESCRSAEVERFVPLQFSTPSQTAWALDALLTSNSKMERSIQTGIQFLTTNNYSSTQHTYLTGTGLPGQFYTQYHSYNTIFPLIALSNYILTEN
ncbi:squalene--hopene cyclase [Bacillus sp. SM2101]|uniref:squalene--hopene cyclase n=1 Tax=Bacillus sp. SM2101 TaxID=2805366 RepID=UPI001BDE0BF3